MVNSTPRPLYPRERDLVHIVQEAGWAPGPVWTGEENLAPTVQHVASRYTDYAIPAHSVMNTNKNMMMTMKMIMKMIMMKMKMKMMKMMMMKIKVRKHSVAKMTGYGRK